MLSRMGCHGRLLGVALVEAYHTLMLTSDLKLLAALAMI
jgi:hypothetical protein